MSTIFSPSSSRSRYYSSGSSDRGLGYSRRRDFYGNGRDYYNEPSYYGDYRNDYYDSYDDGCDRDRDGVTRIVIHKHKDNGYGGYRERDRYYY